MSSSGRSAQESKTIRLFTLKQKKSVYFDTNKWSVVMLLVPVINACLFGVNTKTVLVL